MLVVGGGNTGFQIAKELSSTHKVSLSVGTRQKPLPQRVAGRDLFWWLTKTGLIHKTVDSRLGKRLKERDTLIGSSPRKLKRHYDVELKPRAIAAAGRTVSFEDSERDRGGRGHLGDRVPARLLLDRTADPRFRRTSSPSARRNRCPRSLLPRSHLAAHARLGADRLGEGRRRVHRPADRRPSRRSRWARIRSARRDGPVLPRDHRPPDESSAGDGRARGRRPVRPRDRAGRQAVGRRDRAHARLQPLDPRSDAEGEAGLRGARERHEPRRPGGNGALARSARREPLRRYAPDAGADRGGRELHLPRPVPGPGRVLVPPAHPGGLRPGARSLRQHHRGPHGARVLAAGQPRAAAHARRRVARRGGQGRALQPPRDDLRGHGPFRRRSAHRRRRPTSHSVLDSARSRASSSPTRPTPASSRSACRERG